jgi:hypothetical protein
LPLPSLHIEDDTRGEPRQPVPLRLACLATGLSCADFRYLLAEIQAGGLPYLGACEYRAGDTPRLSPGRPLPEHLAEPAPRAARRCVPGSHPHRPLDAMPRTTLFDGRQVYPRGAYRELLDEALAGAAAGDKQVVAHGQFAVFELLVGGMPSTKAKLSARLWHQGMEITPAPAAAAPSVVSLCSGKRSRNRSPRGACYWMQRRSRGLRKGHRPMSRQRCVAHCPPASRRMRPKPRLRPARVYRPVAGCLPEHCRRQFEAGGCSRSQVDDGGCAWLIFVSVRAHPGWAGGAQMGVGWFWWVPSGG